jgi:hypothetical protein
MKHGPVRLRQTVTYTVEYDAHPMHYDGDCPSPRQMAEQDERLARLDPHALDIVHNHDSMTVKVEAVGAPSLREADVLRQRLMTFGGFQRTERGEFWVSRDDVLRLISEVCGPGQAFLDPRPMTDEHRAQADAHAAVLAAEFGAEPQA